MIAAKINLRHGAAKIAKRAAFPPVGNLLPARFTMDGSEKLEEQLARTCDVVLAGVRRIVPEEKLEGLLLAGGYGRGEGGVLKTAAGDCPYNDLEFYVCVRGHDWLNEKRYWAALHALGESLSPDAGVEVEFKVFSFAKLRHSGVSMFYYDLVMGHRWLWGNEGLLAGCTHQLAAHLIPLSEAIRLLMNRCSGLLFSREQLQQRPFTPEHADFVGRNLAKARLALGDVILTAHGEYHWSCRVRHERLKKLAAEFPRRSEVELLHAEGVEFKLHPWRTTAPPATLQKQHAELIEVALKVWLWLENRRLDYSFASALEYAASSVNKCPETSRWRNWLINGEAFGPSIIFDRAAARYPRERILHALARLLWVPETLHDAELLGSLQRELRTNAKTFPELVAAYRKIWQRFN